MKIPFITINEGHTDQILTRLSTDSPLTCPFRKRGEQERERKREKCVEDKYDKFEAFFRYFLQLDIKFATLHKHSKAVQCKKFCCLLFFFWTGLIGYIVSATKPENFLSSGIPSKGTSLNLHYTISLLIFPPKYLPRKLFQNMN